MLGSKIKRNARGFSLVELMIALVLGLVLSAGIIQVFLANRQSQRVEQTVARLQENGRIALDIITQDLRMAGFYGCAAPVKLGTGETASISSGSFKNHASSLATTFAGAQPAFTPTSILGFKKTSGTWTPALAASLNTTSVTSARDGSDVVAVYYGEDIGARISGDVSGANNISIERPSATSPCFTQNELALVSNCTDSDLVAVTNTPNCSNPIVSLAHTTSLNSDNTLVGSYSSTGMAATSASRPRVLKFMQHVYFVRDSLRKNPSGAPIFSLYRLENGIAAELVEGIEFLKIEFGEKLDSGNIRYVTSDDASIKWQNVIVARVGVLAQSYEPVRDANDTADYAVADQPITATGSGVTHSGGRTLRQGYTATIELRNRLQQ